MNFKITIILIILVLIFGVGLLVFSFVDINKITTSFLGTSDKSKIVDVNNDKKVNQEDIDTFKILFNNKDARADINNDGYITSDDLAQYIAIYREINK